MKRFWMMFLAFALTTNISAAALLDDGHCQDGQGLPCQNKEWNEGSDVVERLLEWIQNAEMDSSNVAFPWDDNIWPCYTESDVESIHLMSNSDIKNLHEMTGENGRIKFKDGKTQLEASRFQNGLAQGVGQLVISQHPNGKNNALIIHGLFKNGCLQGRVRGYTFLPEVEGENEPSNETVLSYIAFYINGNPRGPVWKPVFSYDGIRTGFYYYSSFKKHLPSLMELGGEDVVFIYPDMETAFKGRFSHVGRFIEARQVKIIAERTSQYGIKELRFSEPFGPIYKEDVSSKSYLTSQPLLEDLYECKMVSIKPSTIPIAGEGVFTNLYVKSNTILSYFNGVRLQKSDVFKWNPFNKNSVYLVETADEDGKEMFLDIPMEMSVMEKYSASKGHKVNHAKEANSAYTECDHPRFGKILCLYSLKDLEANTELFTEYAVSFDEEGMKKALVTILGLGQIYSGKPKQEFVRQIKPYMEIAGKIADKLDIKHFLRF